MAAVAHTRLARPRSLRRWTTCAVVSATLIADLPRAGDPGSRDSHIAGDTSAGGGGDAPGDAPATTERPVAPANPHRPDGRACGAGPSSSSAPGSTRSPHREYAHIIGL